jgi:hypothetical protein
MFERKGSSILLSPVNWVCCLREYSLPLSVFNNEKHYPCENGLKQMNRRCIVACVRESIIFEVRESCPLFCSLNWVWCFKEFCLPLSVFMGEEHQLWAKQSLSREWRNSVVILRKSFMLEGRGSCGLLSTLNRVFSISVNCLPLSVFKNQKHYLCWKWPDRTERKMQGSFCERIIHLRSMRP